MKTLRTVLRAFVLGAIAGLLTAPRPGSETRKIIQDKWNSLLDSGPGMNFDSAATGGVPTTTSEL